MSNLSISLQRALKISFVERDSERRAGVGLTLTREHLIATFDLVVVVVESTLNRLPKGSQ